MCNQVSILVNKGFALIVLSHGVFPGPLFSQLIVSWPVCFEDTGYVWYKWIVWIRVT